MNAKILASCKTYVFLDRGFIVNGDQTNVKKAWQRMQVEVLPLSRRYGLPLASKPAATPFLEWLEKYRCHYKWRFYYKILHKLGWLEEYLKRLNNVWERQ
jgi:hypothetical protein